jgi:hypothetical protein
MEPPPRARRVDEPLRASAPNGPLEHARARRRRRPPGPALEEARAHVVGFGKFHGHSLGEIAVFEPSYVDWLVATITTDYELVAAARVIKADLDARGVVRRARPARPPAGRTTGPAAVPRHGAAATQSMSAAGRSTRRLP